MVAISLRADFDAGTLGIIASRPVWLQPDRPARPPTAHGDRQPGILWRPAHADRQTNIRGTRCKDAGAFQRSAFAWPKAHPPDRPK